MARDLARRVSRFGAGRLEVFRCSGVGLKLRALHSLRNTLTRIPTLLSNLRPISRAAETPSRERQFSPSVQLNSFESFSVK